MGSEPRESAISCIRDRLILWIDRLLWLHPQYRSPYCFLLSQDWRDVGSPLLFTREMQNWCREHTKGRYRCFGVYPIGHPFFGRFELNSGLSRDCLFYLYFCHRSDMFQFRLVWWKEIKAANALIDFDLLNASKGKVTYYRLYV